ncbi:DNA (cytosine-5)-methyltransferase 3B-like, partial [Cynoglossus semilaevis]|uniref:DNA (cytosine-5)-methyltransferase 3B-like n=1 Tax=Cynoglossus semilaevis TaxID=244447 RepID=UPI0007DCB292
MDKVETEKTFPLSKSDNPEDQVKPMDWANEGFLPIGETRLKPTQTDGNPLAHSVLRNSLPEDFSTAELQGVSLCKNKAASEEPYSR